MGTIGTNGECIWRPVDDPLSVYFNVYRRSYNVLLSWHESNNEKQMRDYHEIVIKISPQSH